MVLYLEGDYGYLRNENTDWNEKLRTNEKLNSLITTQGKKPIDYQRESHELLSNKNTRELYRDYNIGCNPAVALHRFAHMEGTETWGSGGKTSLESTYRDLERGLLLCGEHRLVYEMARTRVEWVREKYYADSPPEQDRIEYELKMADKSFDRFEARLKERIDNGKEIFTERALAERAEALKIRDELVSYARGVIGQIREEIVSERVDRSQHLSRDSSTRELQQREIEASDKPFLLNDTLQPLSKQEPARNHKETGTRRPNGGPSVSNGRERDRDGSDTPAEDHGAKDRSSGPPKRDYSRFSPEMQKQLRERDAFLWKKKQRQKVRKRDRDMGFDREL